MPTQPSTVHFRYTVEVAGQRQPMNVENTDLDEMLHARKLAAGSIDIAALWTEALDVFVAVTQAQGITPVLAYVPSAYWAYWASVAFEDGTLAPILDAYNVQQVAFLQDYAQAQALRFVDTTPALRQAAQETGEVLYFPGNVHLTRRGHRVVGEALGTLHLARQ